MSEQGLEKAAARTPAVITTPEEYRGALLRWQEHHFNVLTPFANISGLAPQHGILSTVIQINIDKNVGEVYDGTGGMPFLKDGEVALAKNGLRKIAEGLGISTKLEYISVGDKPNYWHVKSIATYRGLDGAIVTREASQEWDLREATVRTKEFGDRQINQARKNGLRNCETRAINAAIRECGCGIKQKYTKQELSRPFLAVRVAFQPDMSDPETRRLITERALGGTAAMYPSSARELPTHDAEVVDDVAGDEPRSVGRGSTATAAQGQTKPAPVTLPEGFGLLQDCQKTELQRRDKKGSFPKWTVVDHEGVPHVTIKREFGEKLERCFKDKVAVDLTSEENSYQENDITEIFEHDPAQPNLPGVGEL